MPGATPAIWPLLEAVLVAGAPWLMVANLRQRQTRVHGLSLRPYRLALVAALAWSATAILLLAWLPMLHVMAALTLAGIARLVVAAAPGLWRRPRPAARLLVALPARTLAQPPGVVGARPTSRLRGQAAASAGAIRRCRRPGAGPGPAARARCEPRQSPLAGHGRGSRRLSAHTARRCPPPCPPLGWRRPARRSRGPERGVLASHRQRRADPPRQSGPDCPARHLAGHRRGVAGLGPVRHRRRRSALAAIARGLSRPGGSGPHAAGRPLPPRRYRLGHDRSAHRWLSPRHRSLRHRPHHRHRRISA